MTTLEPLDWIDSLLFDDRPYEDLTTEGLGIGAQPGRVTAALKAPGVVAGAGIAAALLRRAGARVEVLREDGALVEAGEPILRAEGSAAALHAVYKTAQCVMEYAGGVAARTRLMVERAQAVRPAVQVAGTRKHWPGGKRIALAGLAAGGGIVHRLGLSDSILVFDQHRVFCGDFPAAFARLKARSPERKAAVEATSPEEGLAFVRMGADIVQCERFTPAALAEFIPAARALNPALVVSAAGGVKGANAADYARAGADILVTSWPYWAEPQDVKMAFSRLEGGR